MAGSEDVERTGRAAHIRSFVRRQGRLSNAQQRYHQHMMARIGVPYRAAAVDLDLLFGRRAARILEIGFGMGETSAAIAAAHPENDYLGVEVHTPGVGSLCKLVAEMGLTNLRIVQHDAVEVLRDMLPPGSLDGVHIFFPDPWPKTRHHKRRLLQPAFVELLAGRLRADGYIHCATDWEEYAQQMLAVLSADSLLENTATAFAPRPADRQPTRFEQRGLRLGHGVWDLIFRRRQDSLQAEDHRQDQLA
ncbi:tRNA (guanosine(46)-N7)-methyltransferase TrmB [Accumulibacter sp.]|uniref:tRNA (guanosine(46)-N7)-methyltransferase TrmB n=1 Tax=Accumulibacter sp. TaxID=2053492 RepID=UPI0025D389D3|nr:tRNA (guanosine(46)-N7)-methyltransferase TrmB [Accumulibacter sp.]MCM8613253.1 tRNA (guanosine(46)-N7)-methyltransferase TrmB [Accumulibacter sp.]MCM8636917.1 tRNA (guanosine(46)-N7)-methyltransferase TrmB [Accumulibacter sp.]MCM8638905.1 tRNA (guanosine(46)-N7)-methyltransferase TrmB [Accumulibacter sp.]